MPEQKTFSEMPPLDGVVGSESRMALLLLLDVSGSMSGPAIQSLNDALNRFKEEVCTDQRTSDVLDVAVVAFNDQVQPMMQFTPIPRMEPLTLTASGGTAMGAALRKAIDMVDERYRFYRHMGSEPYCPWIVMITDGAPTDSIDSISHEIETLDAQDKLRVWALGVEGADMHLLNKICHGKRVLALDGYSFTGFFDWVNKSMRAVSVSAPGEKARGQNLPEDVSKAVEDDWM